MLAAAKQNLVTPPPGAQPGMNDQLDQAKSQYLERLCQRIQPQRTGASVTCLHINAQDPIQPQLFGVVVGARWRPRICPRSRRLNAEPCMAPQPRRTQLLALALVLVLPHRPEAPHHNKPMMTGRLDAKQLRRE